jgi:hypothetical protein
LQMPSFPILEYLLLLLAVEQGLLLWMGASSIDAPSVPCLPSMGPLKLDIGFPSKYRTASDLLPLWK